MDDGGKRQGEREKEHKHNTCFHLCSALCTHTHSKSSSWFLLQFLFRPIFTKLLHLHIWIWLRVLSKNGLWSSKFGKGYMHNIDKHTEGSKKLPKSILRSKFPMHVGRGVPPHHQVMLQTRNGCPTIQLDSETI